MTEACRVGDRPAVAGRSAPDRFVSPAPPWARARGALAAGPLVLGVALLAGAAVSAVLAKIGHAGAALDDAYIHFQYARALAEGHPMRFHPGDPVTSGATSLLWPAVLAPFWAMGARDEAIVWVAWALSFAALGALAWEALRLTEPIAGRASAMGAAAMTLACGGLVWSAASGMEVVPFAWLIARAARRSAEWAERARDARDPRRRAELVALAWASTLMRPEGAVTALFVALTLAGRGGVRPWRDRLAAIASMSAVVGPPAVLFLVTGSARSNTAIVKLLPGNPYYAGPALADAVRANLRLLLGTLLNGEIWSAEFLPRGGAPFALAGLASVAWLGARRRVVWRASAVLLLAATIAAPCFYVTFLWNRLRYLWPFATGWIVGLACLARVAGDLAGGLRARWRLATPLACGVFAGLLASKLPGVIDDVAQSASGIDRQQVALGRWAKDALPPSARIGVNDTGAIAYFGGHETFDIVGLTTPDEARYWVAGAGSRFEHYERLHDRAPERLPTYFVVYPEWMAMNPVLGEALHEATVTDSTILGGRTMRAYRADWSALGSGERPWTALEGGRIVDVVDVADLESEAAHGYALLDAREGGDVVREGTSPSGAVVVDGGRTRRVLERFTAQLRPGTAARGIVRLEGSARVRVRVAGEPAGAFGVDDDDGWQERTFDVPAAAAGPRTSIELRAIGGTIATFHYWFVQ